MRSLVQEDFDALWPHAKPDLMIDPAHALEIAAADFKGSNCRPYSDKDDIEAVSSLVYVGHIVMDPGAIIGLKERKTWLAAWKKRLGM